MKKEIIVFALSLILLASITPTVTHAESDETITVSPSNVVMQINDYGKVYDISITNNTQDSVSLTALEAQVERGSDGNIIPLDTEVTKKFFELSPAEFNLAAGQVQKVKVRTKIINNTETTKFPAILISQDEKNSDDVGLNFAFYIPFILQNTSGQLLMNTELTIDVDRFSINPITKISGKVINAGDKFFTPSGTLVVLKDGVKIDEKELTTQISNAIFSGENAEFAIDWQNPDDSFKAAGEYTIQTKITNNLTDKTTVSQIKFIYIPMQLIYIAGGIILLIVLVSLISGIVKAAKRKKQAYK